jgi:hypothetical protein
VQRISIGRLRGGFCVYWRDPDGRRRRHQLAARTRAEAEAEAVAVYRRETQKQHRPATVADLWQAYVDALDGGAGGDTVSGNLGADVLSGGGDADSFSDDAAGLDGDRITDFGADDVITVEGALFDLSDVTVTIGATETLLEIDTDGDTAVDTTITLDGDFAGAVFAASQSASDTDITLTFAPVANDVVVTDPVTEDAVFSEVLGSAALPFAVVATDGDSVLTPGSFSLLGASIDGTPVPGPADAGVSYDPVTGQVVFDPTALEVYQSLPEGATATVEVGFEVTDGVLTDQGSVTFTVLGVNDDPAFTNVPAGGAIAIDPTSGSATRVLNFNADDIDAGDILSFSVSGEDAALLSMTPVTGTLYFNDDPNTGFLSADGDGEFEVTITVADNNGGSATADLFITTNNAPLFVDFPANDEIEVDTEAANPRLVTQFDAEDLEGDDFVFSISGEDADAMRITEGTGVLFFRQVFDNVGASADGDGIFEIDVTVTDDQGASRTRALDVILDPDLTPGPNTAPVITNLPATPLQVDPGAQANQRLVYNFDALDLEGDDVTFSVSGEDAGLVRITAGTGVLLTKQVFSSVPADADNDGVYEIDVTVTDEFGALTIEAFSFEIL